MKIGIFVSSIGNFGQKGFYNAQEIGLAKAFERTGNQVIVYKLTKDKQLFSNEERIENYKTIIKYIPAFSIGTHGISDFKEMENDDLDILIHFSDIQLIVRSLKKWCKKNKVKYIGYVGVIKSNSEKFIVRSITNLIAKMNISAYRNIQVFAKTPFLKEQLIQNKISNVEVTPVGLDLDLLKLDYEAYDRMEIKKSFGYSSEDKLLLFVGRLMEEKNPIQALMILKGLIDKGYKYKLILIGSGYLKDQVLNYINENYLQEYVNYIEKIKNAEMWKLYYISDWFINLNANEIFGMAILEAMYYQCPVIAKNAPGPNYIIDSNEKGLLISDNNCASFVNAVISNEVNKKRIARHANIHVKNKFLWDSTVKKMLDKIC